MTLLLSYPKCPRRLQLWQKCRMWHESLRELTRIEFEIFKFGRFETVSKQPKQPKPQTIQTFFFASSGESTITKFAHFNQYCIDDPAVPGNV